MWAGFTGEGSGRGGPPGRDIGGLVRDLARQSLPELGSGGGVDGRWSNAEVVSR
jgi:hypothetical protein